jgi:hypothetical protein
MHMARSTHHVLPDTAGPAREVDPLALYLNEIGTIDRLDGRSDPARQLDGTASTTEDV